MSDKPTIKITYMDGQTIEFSLPEIAGSRTQMAEAIANARTATNFLLEVDNTIVVVPFANVRTFELDRGSDAQPIQGLLSGAKRIE